MATQGRGAMLVRVFWRRLSILALLALLVVVALGVWKVYEKARESGALRAQAEMNKNELSEQSQDLSVRIAKLKTDRGKEEALRQQYEVGRPGEAMIVIVEPETATAVEEEPTMRQWVQKFLPFW